MAAGSWNSHVTGHPIFEDGIATRLSGLESTLSWVLLNLSVHPPQRGQELWQTFWIVSYGLERDSRILNQVIFCEIDFCYSFETLHESSARFQRAEYRLVL
jgi:hypothetical protein